MNDTPSTSGRHAAEQDTRFWELLVRQDPSSPALLELARQHLDSGEAEEAYLIADRVSRGHPDHLEAALVTARSLVELDRIDHAREVLLNGGWILAVAAQLNELSDLMFRIGDTDGAQRIGDAASLLELEADHQAETALDGSASEAVPTETLAFLYLSQGHEDRAVEIYRKILETDPDNEAVRKKLEVLRPGEAIPLSAPSTSEFSAPTEFPDNTASPIEEPRFGPDSTTDPTIEFAELFESGEPFLQADDPDEQIEAPKIQGSLVSADMEAESTLSVAETIHSEPMFPDQINHLSEGEECPNNKKAAVARKLERLLSAAKRRTASLRILGKEAENISAIEEAASNLTAKNEPIHISSDVEKENWTSPSFSITDNDSAGAMAADISPAPADDPKRRLAQKLKRLQLAAAERRSQAQ